MDFIAITIIFYYCCHHSLLLNCQVQIQWRKTWNTPTFNKMLLVTIYSFGHFVKCTIVHAANYSKISLPLTSMPTPTLKQQYFAYHFSYYFKFVTINNSLLRLIIYHTFIVPNLFIYIETRCFIYEYPSTLRHIIKRIHSVKDQ